MDSLQEQLRIYNVLTKWQDAISKEKDNPFEIKWKQPIR